MVLFLAQRFYRTLSDLKGEVENILKRGRELVDEKKASDLETFNGKLDSLRDLYNKVLYVSCHLLL